MFPLCYYGINGTTMEEKAHNFAIDVKELILTQNGKNMGTETFVYEPSNIEEEALGNLYVIGWLQNKRHELEFLPNLIASVIRREFYAIDERTTEEHFESALHKANATLLDINKTNKDTIRDIHFCIANIVREKVRVCVLGDMTALLSRNNTVVTMDHPAPKRGKTELFSHVITGTVIPGDMMLLGTKTVVDLFSEKGLSKLLSLPLPEQADIISKIYQKNAKEILLPDQALVLIGIRGALESRWIPFKKNIGEKKRIDASPVAHERAFGLFMSAAKKTHAAGTSFFHHARTIPTLSVRKKNARIHIGIFAGIIVFGSVYALVNAQIIALHALEQRIATARTAQDTATATTILQSVQRDALALIPALFTSSAAQAIFHAANTDLNALHGIRITPPSFLGEITTASLAFYPTYIFDDDLFIYVFGQAPYTIAKIEKKSRSQRFTFILSSENDFSTERMIQKNDDFYFINDTKKTAMVWRAADNTLMRTKLPVERSAPNERTVFNSRYTFENNVIMRTETNESKTKYLVGQLPPLTDFTVSRDNTTLYLLAHNALFSLSL